MGMEVPKAAAVVSERGRASWLPGRGLMPFTNWRARRPRDQSLRRSMDACISREAMPYLRRREDGP